MTIEDPTTWTRPWTAKQELKKQSDAANQIYYEPRCHEGNYGLAASADRHARVAEQRIRGEARTRPRHRCASSSADAEDSSAADLPTRA